MGMVPAPTSCLPLTTPWMGTRALSRIASHGHSTSTNTRGGTARPSNVRFSVVETLRRCLVMMVMMAAERGQGKCPIHIALPLD